MSIVNVGIAGSARLGSEGSANTHAKIGNLQRLAGKDMALSCQVVLTYQEGDTTFAGPAIE